MMKTRKETTIVIILALLIVGAVAAVMIYRHYHSFVYNEQLDSVVVSVSDNDITLREISYYVMKVEEQGNEAALIYDENNPKSYWALYMNDEFARSGYVADLAKLSAMDNCIRDYMYYDEALKNNFSLDEELLAEIRYDAADRYNHMTAREKETTGLEVPDLEEMMIREETAHAYILKLAGLYDDKDIVDNSQVINEVSTKYDITGSYYNSLKEVYNVTINEELWDKVRVGFVTIN